MLSRAPDAHGSTFLRKLPPQVAVNGELPALLERLGARTRQKVEDEVDPPTRAVIPATVQPLVVEPPEFAGLHCYGFVASRKNRAGGTIDDVVVTVPNPVVGTLVHVWVYHTFGGQANE